jgi:filamentous hemagglutinin family protein
MINVWLTRIAGSIGILLSIASPGIAQIVPDRTTNSLVRAESRTSARIEGGLQQGQNLFHSFQQFNIRDGERVTITDPGVANILLRVTGNSRSAIEGTLAVTGGGNSSANLFLLNPHGITFGRNAALNLNGSFIATTANAIQFGNQGVFSATDPQPPGLLTVNPSAFLFSQTSHGSIVDRAALSPQDTFSGLHVPDGQSLLLLGGSVQLDTGGLTALGGRVEVGGVVGEAVVGLHQRGGLQLAFDPNTQRANISLENSDITVAGGELAIEANSLRLNGSTLSANAAQSSVDPQGRRAGNITVHAQDQIAVLAGSFIKSEATQANSGQINLQADRAIVLDQSFVTTETFGNGNSGDIDLTAPSVLLDRVSGISATTHAGGNGGNVVVRATDSIRLNGGSSIFSQADRSSTGNAGQVDLQTNQLTLTRSSIRTIAQSTSSIGGNIAIEAQRVQLDQGSELSASTVATDGGNIRIQGADLLSLDRQSQISTNAGQENKGGNGGNVAIAAQFIVANPFSNNDISANAFIGNGGRVDIQSDQIFGIQYRRNGSDRTSDITASSQFGNPGTVRINGLEADPSRGLTTLPTNPIDPNTQVARACSAVIAANTSRFPSSNSPANNNPLSGAESTLNQAFPNPNLNQFVITGRGGLPPSPTDAIGSSEPQVAWARLPAPQPQSRPTEKARSHHTRPDPALPNPVLIEAQGWIVTREGQVELVANAPAIAPAAAVLSRDRCAAR